MSQLCCCFIKFHLYPVFFVRLRQETGGYGNQPRQPEREGRKVHVVDLPDPEGPVVLFHAERALVGKVDDHARETHHETDHEAPESSLLVHPPPADGHAEGHCDGRRQVRREGLDVHKELAALHLLDQGDPQNADHHQDKNAAPKKTLLIVMIR